MNLRGSIVSMISNGSVASKKDSDRMSTTSGRGTSMSFGKGGVPSSYLPGQQGHRSTFSSDLEALMNSTGRLRFNLAASGGRARMSSLGLGSVMVATLPEAGEEVSKSSREEEGYSTDDVSHEFNDENISVEWGNLVHNAEHTSKLQYPTCEIVVRREQKVVFTPITVSLQHPGHSATSPATLQGNTNKLICVHVDTYVNTTVHIPQNTHRSRTRTESRVVNIARLRRGANEDANKDANKIEGANPINQDTAPVAQMQTYARANTQTNTQIDRHRQILGQTHY